MENEAKLKHLEHAEDHVIHAGREGFVHAHQNLTDLHDQMKGRKNDTSITTKYDGSPSIVFGHHPENGKFFVGSKSVFNKTPKVNYSHEDIEKNHGHAPGLVSKLKLALDHLHKVTPKGKIYQGDLMHSGIKSDSNKEGDVEEKNGKLHFKPNTISYSTHSGTSEGDKIKGSKIGVVPHTEYTGKDFQSLKATYNADVSKMSNHKDVHVISPHHDMSKVKYSEQDQKEFSNHMNKANNVLKKAGDFHSAINDHVVHLKTYINKTVRDESKPTLDGYKEHLTNHYNKKIEGVKTQKSKDAKQNELDNHHKNIDSNTQHFNNTLEMHKHLQNAKNVLVKAMSTHTGAFETHIDGKPSKPEGFVTVKNNRPTKIVDREEFSRANFARQN